MPLDDGKEVQPEIFRRAMRNFAGHVSVITVGRAQERSGLVATSAVSLSVEPAMMLVCVNRTASSWPLFERYRHFGVNALRPDQQSIAERFSGMGGVKGNDRYALVAGDSRAPARLCLRTPPLLSIAKSRT
jgi:flavin reductase (DIM6/NTAB) family NADH-FMN oxidoreductase RutF